ncbi:MAG: hypothetical protein ACREHV_17100, partial [Rhizomicrobium sp.]
MLELTNNTLVFRFPEVHPDAILTVTLHRTLRIPDDGREYPLPPSLGHFPVVHVDDYKSKVSPKWVGRGGVMVPMYQSEALWFSLHPNRSMERNVPYPFAIKCFTGKVSALTGKEWSKKLKADDYMVAPPQPWLDGYVVSDGTIKQFVAAPLGLGVTAEGQITGKEEFGGLQLEVLPMLREKFESKFPKPAPRPASTNVLRGGRRLSTKSAGGVFWNGKGSGQSMDSGGEEKCSGGLIVESLGPVAASAGAQNYSSESINMVSLDSNMMRGEVELSECSEGAAFYSPQLDTAKLDMGLAAGGRMQQQVFKDPHGIECWDTKNKTRVYIHLANSIGWQHVTGSMPPHPPLSAADYTAHHYPWFAYYEEGAKSQAGTD